MKSIKAVTRVSCFVKSIKAVIRVSCLVFRENPLAELGVAPEEMSDGQGNRKSRVSCFVKSIKAVIRVSCFVIREKHKSRDSCLVFRDS